MILAVAVQPPHVAALRPRLSPRLHRSSSSTAAVVASAKKLRRRRRPSSMEDATGAPAGEETHDVSSSELEFLAALESEPAPLKRDREAGTSRTPEPLLSSSSGAGGRAPLRGLDVLQAVQHKAAARRKGGGGKGDRGLRRGDRGGGGGGEGHADVRDYSNVRPLDIKGDWGTRLDELDRLVLELLAQQHLYSDKTRKSEAAVCSGPELFNETYIHSQHPESEDAVYGWGGSGRPSCLGYLIRRSK